MYLSHFGLAKKPFEISPDPDFLWLGEKHREGLAILKYGILENKGFLLITGEVGTGKTALIRTIEKEIQARAIIVTIPDPGMTLMDFYNFLAAELKMERHFSNKGDFLIQFKKFILEAFSAYLRVLLIIDESQRLNHDLLEEIRLLSNIDLNGKVLMNIFFVGQNEFRQILTREENRAVRQRITVSYHLAALTEEETSHYIRHRLKVAGTSHEIFSPDALKAVYGFAKGLPRLTNIVCDHAMMTAYVRGLKLIDADIVRESGDDLRVTIGSGPPMEQEKQPPAPEAAVRIEQPRAPAKAPSSHSARGVSIFAGFLLLLFAGWYFYGDMVSDQLAHWGKQRETRQTQGPTGGGNLASAPPLPVETGPLQPQPVGSPADSAKTAIAAAPPTAVAAAPKPPPPASPEPAKIEPSPTPSPPPSVALQPAASPASSMPAGAPPSAPAPVAPPPPAASTAVAAKPAAVPVPSAPATPPPPASAAAEPFKLKEFAVYFAQNSADLNALSAEILTKIAGLVKATPGTIVIIEGHSDSTGEAGYNRVISENRAVSVRNYLVNRGIEPSRLTASGFGSDKPISLNDTPEGRSKNRRAVIRILPGKQG